MSAAIVYRDRLIGDRADVIVRQREKEQLSL